MTHDDLPDPPANTRWLNADETLRATDYCLNRGIFMPMSLDLVGSAAGEPIVSGSGWTYFCRNIADE